jgi:hypothetical protein
VGPTRQPPCLNNGAARAGRVRTAVAAALPPPVLPPPSLRSQLTPAFPTASAAYKGEHPRPPPHGVPSSSPALLPPLRRRASHRRAAAGSYL